MNRSEQTKEDLRRDAEVTREELADTVGGLAAKADIKGRAKDAARRKSEPLRRNPGASAATAFGLITALIIVWRLIARIRH